MNCNTKDSRTKDSRTCEAQIAQSQIAQFRDSLYHCFGTGKDALMNACDALLTEVSARSFPELSLSPCFVRRWPSLYEAFDYEAFDFEAFDYEAFDYEAFDDAKINRAALQTLFV